MKRKTFAWVAGGTLAVLLGVACGDGDKADPPRHRAGDRCTNQGDVYAHGNTRLSCVRGDDGELRWER
jgi:hypothetical protein